MNTKILILIGAAALPLGACSTMDNDRSTLATVATGAALGGAAGTGVAALAGGDLLTGAAIGAAVGGIAGAVWADRDGDGRVDGYTQNGQYYPGAPDTTRVAARTNCPSIGGSALTGAAVGGLAGAVWADSNNDGCVDGYYREGRYYSGAPVVQQTAYRSGERG